MKRRNDIPRSAFAGSSRSAIALEWLGRVAAILAVVLLFMVLAAIHKGLLVQHSAKSIVKDFHTANDFFATRADLGAPAKAKEQLQTLAGVLDQLNRQTAHDVNLLGATVPDVQKLLQAGRGDVDIAGQLLGVAHTLQGSAASLHQIAGGANQTVAAVDSRVAKVPGLIDQLNAQLAITERKLALVPALGGDAK